MTARDEYRRTVAESLTGWRLGCIPPRFDTGPEREIIRSGIAEILAIRLEDAYAPLLVTLERIKHRVGVLADLRREPWAPAGHEVNRRRSHEGPHELRS